MNYVDVRRKTTELMGDVVACSFCHATTTRETLATCGGRCYPCYAEYCRQGRPAEGPRGQVAERIRAEIAATGRKVPL